MDGEILSTDLDSALQFASLAGKFLRTIHLDLDYSTKPVPIVDWDTMEWALSFSTNCPNVTSLEIVVDGGCWIRVFGCRLESLQLFGSPFAVIEDNFPCLRKLTLYGTIDLGSLGGNMWEKIGSTLKSLEISYIVSCEAFLDDIGKINKYCRALNMITITSHIYFDRAMTWALSKLLPS